MGIRFNAMETKVLSSGHRSSNLPESYVRPESERPRLSEAPACDDVPVVDLGCEDRTKTVQQIGDACKNNGFFQVINHGVSTDAVEKMFGVATEFFRLPVEEKLKLYSDDPSKTTRLSTSFNVNKEKVHNWRDYLRLHCYPLDKYVPEWPSNPPSFKIGGSGEGTGSKARTFPGPVSDPAKLSQLNYDGSITDQAPGDDSDVLRYCLAFLKDPSGEGNNILVICVPCTAAGEPIPTNKRLRVAKIINRFEVAAEEPRYGIQQEQNPLQKDVKWPMGWPVGGFPGPQGPYYCGVGVDKAFGRHTVNSLYKACQYTGINIFDIIGKFMTGQGPCYCDVGADRAFERNIVNSNYKANQHAGISIIDIIGKFMPGQGPYYRGLGADKAFGGDNVNSRYKARLYARINISGINGEDMPRQGVAVGCEIEGNAPFLFFFVSALCSIKMVRTRPGRMAGMMAQAAKAWGKSRGN